MSGIIITNREKLTPKHHEHNQYVYTKHEAAQGQMITAFYTLPPGKSNYPFHYHTANEEVFYVISGRGVLETFEGKHPITEGDVIVCPAGKEGAHKITNTSETEALVYLDVDTRIRPEIVYYPQSNKLGVRADGVHENYTLDSGVDYYHHE